jgi:hypothetical protein
MPRDVIFDKSVVYDFFVATCGYERRSSYLCRLGVFGSTRMAVTYAGTRGAVYEENLRLYSNSKWEITDLDNTIAALRTAISVNANYSIAIDVSSMPRYAIGRFVELFASTGSHTSLQVTFLYCPGDFTGSSLAANIDEPMSADAVSKYFAGTIRPPSIPIGLIVGLGLEPYRAAGIIELLEPARTWLFTPSQGDLRFVEKSLAMHHDLLRLSDPDDIFEYSVRSLAKAFSALESLCFSTGLHYRLIMAPSGPKLFSLACMLVASARDASRPAVWRVGSSGRFDPVSVDEAGDVSASVVSFGGRSHRK